MASYTTDELILAVRTKAFLPPVGGMTDAEVLEFINQERRTTTAALMRRASPSYFRTHYDYTLVTGQAEYRVPDRALMNTIEKVVEIDASGFQHPLGELDDTERWKYAGGGRDPHWRGNFAYIMEGEHLRVLPTPTAAEAGRTIRIYYHRQPSLMVVTSEAIRIENAINTLSLTTDPSDAPAALVSGSYADVVRGAGMFGPIATDRLLSDVSSGGLDFDASTPIVAADISTYAIGRRRDYVCVAGETVYTELPLNMWPVLVSASAVAVLTAQKDFGHADAEATRLRTMLGDAASMAEPRSDEPEVIINRSSPLRRGRLR